MPLPEPHARKHIHTRSVSFAGFEREDGLFDIEGRMTDTKTYAFSNKWRGTIHTGEPLHEMLLRVTVDEDFIIHEVAASTEHSPFPVCPNIAANYRSLKGIRMGAGWRRAVREKVGGVRGCTHITELLFPMATVAVQTIFPLQRHRRNEADSEVSSDSGKPFVINTCHAWAEDSPVVKDNAPRFYTGP